jgi:S1-C subfamily serine protease
VKHGIFSLVAALVAVAGTLTSFADPPGEKPGRFGFAFQFPSGAETTRLRICGVEPRGPADQAGLRQADVVDSVDGHRDFRDAYDVYCYLFSLQAGHPLVLEISRGDESLTVTIVAAEATPEQRDQMKKTLQRALAARERAEHRQQQR